MKIKLNSCYAVYSWHWDVPDDELCGICRVSFDGTCTTCKYPGDECPIVIGECQHAFHMHCIWKWLETETAKGLCPMCRQAFKMDKDKEVNKGVKIPMSSSVIPSNTSNDEFLMNDTDENQADGGQSGQRDSFSGIAMSSDLQ